MSDERLKVKNTKIKDIFKSMEFGKQTPEYGLAKTWLNQHKEIGASGTTPSGSPSEVCDVYNENVLLTVYTPGEDVIRNVLNANRSSLVDLEALERTTLVYKFASEIQKNIELISQIELLLRGILPDDTKNIGVKLFTEYLLYYANWTVESKTHEILNGRVNVAILPDDSSLAMLGCAVAPSLALGVPVVLQTGTKLSVCATLIAELAVKAGIPEGTINIIPGNVQPKVLLSHTNNPHTVAIFDDLYSEKYSKLPIHKVNCITGISNLKSPVIVFNNADLDSACDSIVRAVWEYHGMLPWSADTVIVQEDIFENFVNKLKAKLGDMSYPPTFTDAVHKLQRMIEDANSQGIEVFRPTGNDETIFQPTLFIGGRVYGNNVIIENNKIGGGIPTATVLAFRTANEAVALANNGRQGLAASIWSQNVDLVHEVARKLTVGNVWINCHGVVHSDVAFTPHKGSGFGYFGGPEGLCEYTYRVPLIVDSDVEEYQPSSDINGVVAAAKKAQAMWSKLSMYARIQKLSKWAQDMGKNTEEWKSSTRANAWISSIYDSFKELSNPNTSTTYETYDLKTYREPVGVVALIVNIINAVDAVNLAVAALLLGNTIIVSSNDNILEKYALLANCLSSPLVFTTGRSNTDAIVNHKDVATVFSTSLRQNKAAFGELRKIYTGENDWKYMLRRLTQTKNVWSTVGDSFV